MYLRVHRQANNDIDTMDMDTLLHVDFLQVFYLDQICVEHLK